MNGSIESTNGTIDFERRLVLNGHLMTKVFNFVRTVLENIPNAFWTHI